LLNLIPLILAFLTGYQLVRSDKAWKAIFRQAGLRLIQEKVQDGLPEGLFVVKMWVMFCQIFPDL
jgi:hypothetical protein